MTSLKILILVVMVFVSIGCSRINSVGKIVPERDVEVICMVLKRYTKYVNGDVYLSSTSFALTPYSLYVPRNYPDSVLATLKENGLAYLQAEQLHVDKFNDAYTRDGDPAVIQWIALEWENDNTVIVDFGILDRGNTGGQKIRFMKRDGKWYNRGSLGGWLT